MQNAQPPPLPHPRHLFERSAAHRRTRHSFDEQMNAASSIYTAIIRTQQQQQQQQAISAHVRRALLRPSRRLGAHRYIYHQRDPPPPPTHRRSGCEKHMSARLLNINIKRRATRLFSDVTIWQRRALAEQWAPHASMKVCGAPRERRKPGARHRLNSGRIIAQFRKKRAASSQK